MAGLALARGIGHVSYRSENELQQRFANKAQGDEEPLSGGRYAVESYLEHHGDKMIGRFDANSYLVLSEAMNHYDIGRGFGGAKAALSRVRAQVTIAGISSDRLYPLKLQRELADILGAGEVRVVESSVGHDGFLVEHEAVGTLVREALSSWRRGERLHSDLRSASPKAEPSCEGGENADGDEHPAGLPVRADRWRGRHLVEHRGVEHPVVQAHDPADKLDKDRPRPSTA